ncbi:F-box/kelch-repeat protein At3g06240-like [Papaver somniferum]|uniref:F-box/kelch-repeat protein At3g06240-like n=1 Tax=Papaver somniferum TaxID=3469 RepID=UPI000E702DAA|nr:F-box/kelch-repeat protein At3g06240-like [Papaver somniferum]
MVWFACYYDYSVGESFCLWNPATKEYKELPKPPDVDDTFGIWVSGFAYDKNRGDYNVINCYDSIVQVYSLELNSWKIIEISVSLTPQRTFGSLEAGVFFNEDFHWIHGDKVVVSLDLINERINEIQLPRRFSNLDFDLYLMLAVLEGCLCLLKSHLLSVGVEVWVMQDYGVQKTWTKSFIINNESNGFMRRVWSSKKGEILIEVDGDQVLYNHKFGTVRKQNNQSLIGTRTRGENYFESLVSLNAGTYVQEKKHE